MSSERKEIGTSDSERKTWERRILDAKKKHRSSLKNWAKDRYAYEREPAFHALRNPIEYNEERYRVKAVPKLNAYDLPVEEFLNYYEKNSIPIIIQNIPQKEGWKSVTESNWNMKNLLQNYSNEYLKCGEDDDGYKINIRLKYFHKYMKNNYDDSPLYIFDSAYGDIPKNGRVPRKTNAILYDYQIPSYFPHDLFELVGEKRRPPYRWFLIGPERSGTTIHIDPLGTSAWNTLISGRKRWILFPPELKKDFVKGKNEMLKGEDDEAINYFVDIYPRMKEKYLSVRSSSSEYSNLWAYEFIQEPGETVFVPSGWWHTVINLDDTIAITQNYCSYNNFDIVWRKTRTGRKKMAVKWLKKLEKAHPTLYQRAWELNKIDEFEMVKWKGPIPTFPTCEKEHPHLIQDKDKKKKKKEKKSKKDETDKPCADQMPIDLNEKSNKKRKRSHEDTEETNTDTTIESIVGLDENVKKSKKQKLVC